jgi:2-oxoglutarate dehydrogenase complex dehydrogenase (E1) component-like enzyme
MRVCIPTTAAQYFHLLRSQVRDAKRIPLVVMTPKSLLRHPKASSKVRELTFGQFELVLGDPAIQDAQSIRRVLLCSGKIFYDLLAEREKRKNSNTAIIRLEQLYPVPEWNVAEALKSYEQAKEIYWVQEEPQWSFMSRNIAPMVTFGCEFRYIGRPEKASPAPGSFKAFRREQEALIRAAFE